MARKFLSLEELVEDSVVSSAESELEASPEEGEVADVEVEVVEDTAETEDMNEMVDDAIDSAEQMEEVEEVVEKAAENEEGLDPVAAEALRIAIEAIAARARVSAKPVLQYYAAENFTSKSSRKYNTQIALEGIGEFLRNLWEKIKAAISKLLNAAKDFFDKHFGSLARIRKAVESMKEKVVNSSGKFKESRRIDSEKAPDGLRKFFPTGEVSSNLIEQYIDNHAETLKKSDKINEFINHFKNRASATINSKEYNGGSQQQTNGATGGATASQSFNSNITDAVLQELFPSNLGNEPVIFNFGDANASSDTVNKPLVGGIGIVYTFEIEIEEDSSKPEINIDKEIVHVNADWKDNGIILADKSELRNLLNKLINDIIKPMEKFKEKQSSIKEAFNKLSSAMDKSVNTFVKEVSASLTDEQKRIEKYNRAIITSMNKVFSKFGTIYVEMFKLHIKLCKGVLSYASLCLANYKPNV